MDYWVFLETVSVHSATLGPQRYMLCVRHGVSSSAGPKRFPSCWTKQSRRPCCAGRAASRVQKTVAIPTSAVLGHCVHTRCLCVWCRLPDGPDSADNFSGTAAGAVLLRLWTSLGTRSDSPGSAGRCLQFCSIFRPPSVWTLSPKWRGRREFDSWVLCHSKKVH